MVTICLQDKSLLVVQTNRDFSSVSCRGPFQKSASEGPSCASLLSESVKKIQSA